MTLPELDPDPGPVAPPTPSGVERRVGVDELFFSTTDRRGVIRAANSVFCRVSGYPADRLVGAPHNLVRHPDMPAGVFALLWDRLLAGQPTGAYVLNLAADGRHYWVFATVTPLGDGFLSVRLPLAGGVPEAVRGLYEQLRAHEESHRRAGASRTEAARRGAEQLAGEVAALGFADYDSFMTHALAAEVGAREVLARDGWGRTDAAAALADRDATTGGHVASILLRTHDLDGLLTGLVRRLDDYAALATRLDTTSRSSLEAAEHLESATAAALEASEQVTGTAPVLASVARTMSRPTRETVATLHSVVGDLAELRTRLRDLRWVVALARAHTDMVAAFAAEVADGQAPLSALGEVPLLCDALADGVEQVADAVTGVDLRLAEVGASLARAGELFDDARRFVGKWRLLVLRHGADEHLAGQVGPIDSMLAAGHEQLADLRALAHRCSVEDLRVDRAAFDEAIEATRAAALALG